MKRISALVAFGFIATALCSRLHAQANESFYSMFGIGDLIDDNIGFLRSFGGTGIAFRSESSINYRNPSSNVWIPSNTLLIEIGSYGIYSTNQNARVRESYTDLNISFGSISTHVTDWWAISMGILPFSRVGHVTESSFAISGERSTYRTLTRGYGGLHKIFLGHSLKILGNFSGGIDLSYVGGTITEKQSSTGNNTLTDNSRESVQDYGTFLLDYGLQHTIVTEQTSYTLGLVYGSATKLPYTERITLTSGEATTLEPKDHLDKWIPTKFGLGLAFQKSNTLVGFDFEWKNWSIDEVSQRGVQSVDSRRYSVGAEFSPTPTTRQSRRISYRIGANFLESHLRLKNIPIHSVGVAIGIGMPFNASYINLAVEYGRKGSLEKGLILNSWWSVHLSTSFLEFWLPELPQE